MIGTAANLKAPDRGEPPTTRRINVTEMTPNQRRELFKNCLNQTGFTGFTKTQDKQNKQTIYAFTYQSSTSR